MVESEDRDSRFSDVEGRCDHDGRKKSLEPLSRLGQLRRHAPPFGMDFGTDMVRWTPRARCARRPWPDRVRPLSSGPPESRSIQGRPSGVEHHLDDAHVLKEARDVGAERCAPSRSPTGIKFIVPHLGGAIPMLMNRHDKQGHGATGRRCHFGYVYFRKSGDTAVPNSMCLRIRPTSRAALIGAGSF